MPEPEPPTYPVPVEERWLVFYWDLDTGQWVMVAGRQFAAEKLARDVHREYCRVLGPERSRIVHTLDWVTVTIS